MVKGIANEDILKPGNREFSVSFGELCLYGRMQYKGVLVSGFLKLVSFAWVPLFP